jgi:hypothetical protein
MNSVNSHAWCHRWRLLVVIRLSASADHGVELGERLSAALAVARPSKVSSLVDGAWVMLHEMLERLTRSRFGSLSLIMPARGEHGFRPASC